MKNIQFSLIGLAVGLIFALIVYIRQSSARKKQNRKHNSEIEKLRKMLTDRMDLEAEGVKNLKTENEDLKKKNENLRITNAALMQKPGRQELQRLQVYQKTVDNLTINAPGFGQAWQNALREAEKEFEQVINGNIPFWKRILVGKNEPKMINSDSETVDKQ